MINTQETRILIYRFNPMEKAENAQEMARLLGEMDEMKLRHKEIVDGLKQEATSVVASLSKHGRYVRDGADRRDVSCHWVMNYPQVGHKTLCRDDDHEVVETRVMEDYERQELLKFEVAAEEAALAKADREREEDEAAAANESEAQAAEEAAHETGNPVDNSSEDEPTPINKRKRK